MIPVSVPPAEPSRVDTSALSGRRVSVRTAPLPAISDLEALWHGFDSRRAGSFFTSWPWIATWLSVLPSEIEPELLIVDDGGYPCGAAIVVRCWARRHGMIAVRQIHLNAT